MKLKILKNVYVVTTLVFIISIAVTIAIFFWGTRGNTIDSLELGLYRLDMVRSTLLWLANQFFWFIIVVVLFAAFMLYIYHRKLRLLKEGKKIALFTLVLMFISFTLTSPSTLRESVSAELEQSLVDHVFFITLDGANAIDFWQNTPFMSSLANESTKAEAFVTVFPTITYPAHTSLVTGTYPQNHGIVRNQYGEVEEEDIFELAAQYGLTTYIVGGNFMGMFGEVGKTQYRLGWHSSEGFMDIALSILVNETKPNLMFIYQPDPDDTGHKYGSESREYKAAIRGSDTQIGRLVNYLKEAGLTNNSCIFVTADHGMAGRSHYNRFPPLVINVPLWMWGPCFKRNGTIRAARIVDIAPTIAVILGLPKPANSLGIPIWDALNETYYEKVRGDPVDLRRLRMNDLQFAQNSLVLDVTKFVLINGAMFFVTALALVAVWDQRRKFIKLKKRQI